MAQTICRPNQNKHPEFMITRNSVLKIIIVHEDFIAGIEAAAVLRRLAAQLEAEFELKGDAWQIDNGLWKFEMLHNPELWEQAAAEAVAADMIIISVCDAELPGSVRDWLENVLPVKEGKPAALVALLDPGIDPSGEPLRSEAYLRRLAEQYGLDFFCNTDDQPRCVEPIISSSESNSAIWRSFSAGLLLAGMGHHRT
jgi:hypothetical protein